MTILLSALAVALVTGWAWENGRRKTHPVTPGLQRDICVPYTEPFELYHNALSLCSMKTRVCLSELGIPYASHHVDLIETGAYENIRKRLLDVNPAGTVPVLVHEGHPIYESHEQLRYAAEHAGAASPSLVPEDPKLREEMERWIDRTSLTGDPLSEGDLSAGNAVPGLTVPLFAAMIERIAYWRILEGLLFHFDKRRPLLFLALKVRGVAKLHTLGPAIAALQRSMRQMRGHLAELEKTLAERGGPWILGEQFTLADVGWIVIFERLAQVDSLRALMSGGAFPECHAYWERLKQRPSHRLAILDHSHPTIEFGTRRLQAAKRSDPALRAALDGSAG